MSKKKAIYLTLLSSTLLLIGVITLFELTNLDLTIQDKFYNFQTNCWMIDRSNPVLNLLFYTGPKYLYAIFGIFCLAKLILTPKNKESIKNKYFKVLLCLILIPLTISGIKKVSNIYTPHQTLRYGGSYPHVGVFESYPEDFNPKKSGRGWPAGHASGGFSLMALYYFFTKRRNQFYGLSVGLLAGWLTGLYQTLNGQHYISHSFITMLIAWILINIIELTVKPKNVEQIVL